MKVTLTLILTLFLFSGQFVTCSVILRPYRANFPQTDVIEMDRAKRMRGGNIFASAFAGAVSCCSTHSVMVPLDVIKTKLQAQAEFAHMNMFQAFLRIVKSGGSNGLLQGLAATSSGYFLQGACKFGLYEHFKVKFKEFEPLRDNKLALLLLSSGLAEVFACWALCPLESTRIFTVTNPASTAKGMISTMKLMVAQNGLWSLYQGLPLIMLRQVPYTCVKLAGYDVILQAITGAAKAFTPPSKAHTCSNGGTNSSPVYDGNNVLVQSVTGVSAGVLAACVSHPADVILSRVCGTLHNAAASSSCRLLDGPGAFIELCRDVGLRGCFTGLQARALMVGVMTAMQFVIYENTKKTIINVYNSREPVSLPG